jgi:hypothetical protein
MRRGLSVIAACVLVSCGVEDPPGRSTAELGPTALKRPSASAEAPPLASASTENKAANEPGHGAKLASIAMRTWIYVAPDDRSTKLGYLRAGAVIDRAEASAGNTNCAGGWYRVVPRGFVCVGKGASLSLDHPVTEAAVRGPLRDGNLPYVYVTSRSPPPHLYFRLPTHADQRRVEGATLGVHLAELGLADFRNVPSDPVPAFLAAGRDLPKPYGAEEKLHYSVHTGRAREASAFGLVTTFDWTGRKFGLTTELDLIPLDRTKLAHPSQHHGFVVEGDGTPAMVTSEGTRQFRYDGNSFHEAGDAPRRSGWSLTGNKKGGLMETTKGIWLPAEGLLIAERREDPNGYALSGKKWIDVSIKQQLLVAYEGKRAVYATTVSTGLGGMGDPKETRATARGVFTIHAKHVSATMDGDEATDSYDLRDVPFIQYFFEGYALHGAFWHDDFGKVHSHGCVNLAPLDAAWMFNWTDPQVPLEWHGAVSAEGGTLVWVHG